MEQVTITEYPLRPVGSGWNDPVPSVWTWDGETLEVLSWIHGVHRFHASMRPRFGEQDSKRSKRVMLSVGFAKGDRKVPNRWSWIGTTYGLDASEYHAQLRPLLDRVRAAWGG